MKNILIMTTLLLVVAATSCKKEKDNDKKKVILTGTTWVHKHTFGSDTIKFLTDTKVRVYGDVTWGMGTYDHTGTYHFDDPKVTFDVDKLDMKSGTVNGNKMTVYDDAQPPETFEFHKL